MLPNNPKLSVRQGGRARIQAASRFPFRQPYFDPWQSIVGFLDIVALGQVSPSALVSLANSHVTACSTPIIIHHLGLVQ
jgi:hypothetical protein